MLAKLKTWLVQPFKKSLTIAWAYLLAAAGLALEALPPVLDLLGVPEVAAAVTGALGPYAGVYTIGLAVVTYAVRMRSLGKAA